jgi:hypothetical protein
LYCSVMMCPVSPVLVCTGETGHTMLPLLAYHIWRQAGMYSGAEDIPPQLQQGL